VGLASKVVKTPPVADRKSFPIKPNPGLRDNYFIFRTVNGLATLPEAEVKVSDKSTRPSKQSVLPHFPV
jgi:hypothetical protein